MKRKSIKKYLVALLCCAAAAVTVTATACSSDEEVVESTAAEASSVVSEVSEAVSSEEGTVSSEAEAKKEVKDYEDALEVLKEGNDVYTSGDVEPNVTETLREDLSENGQTPHTVVITCSDSRVPPELIFNSGLGELFTIRTAGNVIADYERGSVEYAVDHLGSPLILVMGHSHCGAVAGAIEGHASGDVADIVEEIAPSVEAARQQTTDEEELAALAEDLNVENSIDDLLESEIIRNLISEGKLAIQGAKYDIDTGKVTYTDDLITKDNLDDYINGTAAGTTDTTETTDTTGTTGTETGSAVSTTVTDDDADDYLDTED